MSDKESLAFIKAEPEEESCAEVFEYEYDEVHIKSELELLYAQHEFEEEMVIGPTEIYRPPPVVHYPHWEAARRAVANAGVNNEVEYLLQLYSSRLVLRDAAHELLCARCGQWSLTAAELIRHQRVAHAIKAKPFTCHHCHKSFSHKSQLYEHSHVHTGIKLFSCNECGKSFSYKSSLVKHFVIHEGTQPFACGQCDQRFTHKSNLSKHLLLHKGIKPFKCDICEKSFSRKYNLNQHLTVHSDFIVKPFACDECGKCFTTKSNLSKHTLVHKGLKFPCYECGKSFSYKAYLSEHLRNHCRRKAFAGDDPCDKTISYPDICVWIAQPHPQM